jgi:hypothetical protein
MTLLTHKPLDSSVIKMVGWDSEDNTLIVQFQSLTVWAYYNISEQLYNSFIASDSMGYFFNKNIRNMFDSHKIISPQEFSSIKEISFGQEED